MIFANKNLRVGPIAAFFIWKAYAWTYMHSHLLADNGHYEFVKEFKHCMM